MTQKGFFYDDVREKVSEDLNISLQWVVAKRFEEMIGSFQNGESQVIAYTVDVPSTKMMNMTK